MKIKEIMVPLGIKVRTADELNLPDVEETGTTFAENSLLKSKTYAQLTQLICIADDSGLCVDALNGAPGVYSARYAPNRDFNKGIEKLFKEMGKSGDSNRKAHFTCVISLAYPQGEYHIFEGRVDGKIAVNRMDGNDGFGYDPVFIPDGYSCSFAQMDNNEKNKISHRGKAMQKLKDFLEQL